MHLGAPEIILIVVVVLLLFGGKKLPELARGIGKGLTEFRRATNDIKQEIQSTIDVTATPPPKETKAESSNPPPSETSSEESKESENPSSSSSEKTS